MPLRIALSIADPGLLRSAVKALDAAPSDWSISIAATAEAAGEADVTVVASRPAASRHQVTFDPARPQDLIPAIEAGAGGAASVVVGVSSACRGSGVTTIALHLARELSSRGESCFVDLDETQQVAARLQISEPDHKTWADLGPDTTTARRAALPVAAGFRVLFAPERPTHDPSAVIARAAKLFAVVIVDRPPLGALPPGSHTIVVLPPGLVAARRTRRLLDQAPEQESITVVTNRLGPGGAAIRRDLEEVLGHPIALQLPCSGALRTDEDTGELVRRPWNAWSRGIARLARNLGAG